MKVEATSTFFKSIENLFSWRSKYRHFKGWIKHAFNKYTRKVVKTALNGREWDWSYLYQLEQVKIEQMIAHMEEWHAFEDCEHVTKYMKICYKLIDVLLHEDRLFHFDGDIQFVPIKDTDKFELVKTHDFKYNCDVKVNLKNMGRFVSDEKLKKFYLDNPHEFYLLKAKHLYHKIRFEKDGEWWD